MRIPTEYKGPAVAAFAPELTAELDPNRQPILVVEDNIRYYSSFLPVIYTELITQSRRAIRDGINMAHRLLRMRARPKILLAKDYESAAALAMKYQANLLGVVSDVNFPRHRELGPEAGFELAALIREAVPDVPIVLQSSREQFRERARPIRRVTATHHHQASR